jgi:hypothetical protein
VPQVREEGCVRCPFCVLRFSGTSCGEGTDIEHFRVNCINDTD